MAFCGSRLVSAWLACFCLELSLTLKSNELAITPTELKPIRAPAIDGVSIVPVTGSNAPAAMGSPTCKVISYMRMRQQKSEQEVLKYTSNLSW